MRLFLRLLLAAPWIEAGYGCYRRRHQLSKDGAGPARGRDGPDPGRCGQPPGLEPGCGSHASGRQGRPHRADRQNNRGRRCGQPYGHLHAAGSHLCLWPGYVPARKCGGGRERAVRLQEVHLRHRGAGKEFSRPAAQYGLGEGTGHKRRPYQRHPGGTKSHQKEPSSAG